MKSAISLFTVLGLAMTMSSHTVAQPAQNFAAQKPATVSTKINLRNELDTVLLLAAGGADSFKGKQMMEACWFYSLNPSISLPKGVQLGVSAEGNIMWDGSKQVEFHEQGKTNFVLLPLPDAEQIKIFAGVNYRLLCALAIFDQSPLLAKSIVRNPLKKDEILVKHIGQLGARMDRLFSLNPNVEIGLFAEEGNAGFSRSDSVGHGYVDSKAQWMREVIYEKIAAYRTTPIKLKIPCESGVCESKFVVKSDGKQLFITRDGFAYLSDRVIGGIQSNLDIGNP